MRESHDQMTLRLKIITCDMSSHISHPISFGARYMILWVRFVITGCLISHICIDVSCYHCHSILIFVANKSRLTYLSQCFIDSFITLAKIDFWNDTQFWCYKPECLMVDRCKCLLQYIPRNMHTVFALLCGMIYEYSCCNTHLCLLRSLQNDT